MSRSGYTDDCENLALWRGTIASATRGKRGQRFFRDLVAALDAMPAKRLSAGELGTEDPDGDVCALGSLARAKGARLDEDDTEDYEKLGEVFDIAPPLAREVMYVNDKELPVYPRRDETPTERWARVRLWAEWQIEGIYGDKGETE